MAARAPIARQITAEKMQTFIEAFHRVSVEYPGRGIAWLGDGFILVRHPFQPDMSHAEAYSYLKYLVHELKIAEEPRLVILEPLCKLDKEAVCRVGEVNKALVVEFKVKKEVVSEWRRKWYERVDNLLDDYRALCSENLEEGGGYGDQEECEFLRNALDEADDVDKE